MKLATLTCTGNRPLALALCDKYLNAQTRQPDYRIMIDDGAHPSITANVAKRYVYDRRFPLPTDPPHTLVLNMRKGLDLAEKLGVDILVMAEDDDVIFPPWLEYVEREIEKGANIVGEGHFYYYNVFHRKWLRWKNVKHAALCATAIHKNVFPLLREMLESTDPYIDIRLWAEARQRFKWSLRKPMNNDCMVVGMKGVPGRPGQGQGHEQSWEGWSDDKDCKMLDLLLGKYAEPYKSMWKGDWHVDSNGPLLIGASNG